MSELPSTMPVAVVPCVVFALSVKLVTVPVPRPSSLETTGQVYEQ